MRRVAFRSVLSPLNVVACALHAVLFVATLAVSRPSVYVPLYMPVLNVTSGGQGWSMRISGSVVAGWLNLSAALACVFLITAIFHAGNACVWSDYYVTQLRKMQTPTRWAEYALSAPLMAVIIAYFCGMLYVVDVIAIFFLTSSTMLFGYLQEIYNEPSADRSEWRRPLPQRLVPHLMGYIPFCLLVGVVAASFARLSDVATPPLFVFAIVAAELLLFSLFAVVQLCQYLTSPRNFVRGEVAFVVLSFASKATLGIILLANTLSYS